MKRDKHKISPFVHLVQHQFDRQHSVEASTKSTLIPQKDLGG